MVVTQRRVAAHSIVWGMLLRYHYGYYFSKAKTAMGTSSRSVFSVPIAPFLRFFVWYSDLFRLYGEGLVYLVFSNGQQGQGSHVRRYYAKVLSTTLFFRVRNVQFWPARTSVGNYLVYLYRGARCTCRYVVLLL